jgi:hypothetical protein
MGMAVDNLVREADGEKERLGVGAVHSTVTVFYPKVAKGSRVTYIRQLPI